MSRGTKLTAMVVAALLSAVVTGAEPAAATAAGRAQARAGAVPSSQAATVHCGESPSPTNCDHQDPVDGWCASEMTTLTRSDVFTYGGVSWRLEHQYSLNCRTRWTQLRQYGGSRACMYPPDGGYFTLMVTTGYNWYGVERYDEWTVVDANGNGMRLCDGAYGNMVYEPYPHDGPALYPPYSLWMGFDSGNNMVAQWFMSSV